MGAQVSKTAAPAPAPAAQPEGIPRYWYRDNFLLTTDKAYLDPTVINDVFDSDLMWWNDPLEPAQVRMMLANCLTFGIYAVPETEAQMKKNGPPTRQPGDDLAMVGFARVVTDYTTFAYLTDVFVLKDYQRRGLAGWMVGAVKEVVDGWPALRGLILMTSDGAAANMYRRELGAVDFDKGPSAGLMMLEMEGKGSKPTLYNH